MTVARSPATVAAKVRLAPMDKTSAGVAIIAPVMISGGFVLAGVWLNKRHGPDITGSRSMHPVATIVN
jgi:hypothetical protein